MIDYPNTTPVPNEVMNSWLSKLKGSELKILLVVTRKTLGWVLDNNTGMRKEEDWITYSQMRTITGLSHAAVCSAVNSLIEHVLIETRDEGGNVLPTSKERMAVGKARGKIFYRLNFETLKSSSYRSKKDTSTGIESRPDWYKNNTSSGIESKPVGDKKYTSTGIESKPYKRKIDKRNPYKKGDSSQDMPFELYKYYIKMFKKNPKTYRPLPGRLAKVKTRLGTWTPRQIAIAIRNASQDDFYSGKNDRGWVADLSYICRNDENVEKLIGLSPKSADVSKKVLDEQYPISEPAK